MATAEKTLTPCDPVTETVVTIPQAAEHFQLSKPYMWALVLGKDGEPPKVASFTMGKRARRTTLEAVARAFCS